MLGEHLQAGRITRERETQCVEPFPGRRAAAAARGSPAACELYNGSANEDASGMASATPDARPLSPREGGRSRSSARGGSGEKKTFSF